MPFVTLQCRLPDLRQLHTAATMATTNCRDWIFTHAFGESSSKTCEQSGLARTDRIEQLECTTEALRERLAKHAEDVKRRDARNKRRQREYMGINVMDIASLFRKRIDSRFRWSQDRGQVHPSS